MKIATHISVQIAALVITGTALAMMVSDQTSAALEAREQVQGDARDLETFERFSDVTGHLFLAADLVLSGGTTYLAPLAEEQAHSLGELLAQLKVSPLLQGHGVTCDQLAEDTRVLEGMVSASLALSGEDRDDQLYALLESFDERSMDMSDRIEELRVVMDSASETRKASVERRVERARSQSMLAMLGFLAVILFSWTYLNRAIGSPIKRLADRAHVARGGETFDPPKGGPHEVRGLSAGFAELVQGLEDARDGLEETVAERTEDLERALKARSEFLANTSHELRTPLNAILGFADLLAVKDIDAEESAEFVHHIRTSGRHLLSLITDVLDLTKIDAGHMQVERVAYCPTTVVAEVDSMLRRTATGKGLALTTTVADDVPKAVLGDAMRLRQILVNVTGNALKFTLEGRVQISMSWHADRLCVEIEDTGIGIPEFKREAIFAAFEQADASDTRRFGGLGLAISRQFARLMGGDLLVSSVEGQGSTFRLELPATECESASAADMDGEEDFGPAPGAHILIVDDVMTNRLLGRRILEHMGVKVTEAQDGEAAIQAVAQAEAEEQPFDAILMDLQMPGIDGYDATRRILANGYPGPIIALSAAVMPEHRKQALESGCVDFLAKPIQQDALRRSLNNVGQG